MVLRLGETDYPSLLLETRKKGKIPNQMRPELPPVVREASLQMWKEKKPNARFRCFTGTYNCIGMVVASRRTWVDTEELLRILDEDGYRKLATEAEVDFGDVVVYRDTAGRVSHAAIVTRKKCYDPENPGDTLVVLSKWVKRANTSMTFRRASSAREARRILDRPKGVATMKPELFFAIEHPRLSAQVNVASGYHQFIRALAELPEVRQLQAHSRTMDDGLAIFLRIVALVVGPTDPAYENPHDVALAAYLWVLHVTLPQLAEVAAQLVASCSGCWWSRKLAADLRPAAADRPMPETAGTRVVLSSTTVRQVSHADNRGFVCFCAGPEHEGDLPATVVGTNRLREAFTHAVASQTRRASCVISSTNTLDPMRQQRNIDSDNRIAKPSFEKVA